MSKVKLSDSTTKPGINVVITQDELLRQTIAERDRAGEERDLLKKQIRDLVYRSTCLLLATIHEQDAYKNYLDVHGVEHSGEDCPGDDTCSCPEIRSLRDSDETIANQQSRMKLALNNVTGKPWCKLWDEFEEDRDNFPKTIVLI